MFDGPHWPIRHPIFIVDLLNSFCFFGMKAYGHPFQQWTRLSWRQTHSLSRHWVWNEFKLEISWFESACIPCNVYSCWPCVSKIQSYGWNLGMAQWIYVHIYSDLVFNGMESLSIIVLEMGWSHDNCMEWGKWCACAVLYRQQRKLPSDKNIDISMEFGPS